MRVLSIPLKDAELLIRKENPDYSVVRTPSGSIFTKAPGSEWWKAAVSTLIDGRIVAPGIGETTIQFRDSAFRKMHPELFA